MAEHDRQNALELMGRLQESAHANVMASSEYPLWLAVVVSQILALTGDERIITCGHDLKDYDLYKVLTDDDDTAKGKVQVLTETLLVVSEFAAPNQVRTRAVPLRESNSLTVTKIREVLAVRGDAKWPDYVNFEMDLAGSTYSFPVVPATATGKQCSEVPAALEAVKAFLSQK